MRLTVFCHVHYLDVWEEVSERLVTAINLPFNLVVTTSLAASTIKQLEGKNVLRMNVVEIENRGRDIRPFLQAVRDEPEFDVGLKLHTKKSTHRLDGDKWRRAIISSLLPNDATVRAVSACLFSNKAVGIIAPSGALSSIAPWIGRNRPCIEDISRRMGLDPLELFGNCPYFVAGSMFWFRPDALKRFVRSNFDDLFTIEAGQTDGTAAHALERLFAPVAEADGWTTLSMSSFDVEDMHDLKRQREVTLADVDTDLVFLRRPHPFIIWLSTNLPSTFLLYKRLPGFIRSSLRTTIRIMLYRHSNGKS